MLHTNETVKVSNDNWKGIEFPDPLNSGNSGNHNYAICNHANVHLCNYVTKQLEN